MQRKSLPSLIKVGLALLTFGVMVQIQAADASGTWTWTVPGRNGGPDRKSTLKLKVDGDKVTGKLSTPGRQGNAVETEIEDGKVKGDDVSFKVTREFQGNKVVTKYHGKVSADSIKGKMEFERNGQSQERDWEAKREGDKK